jgi:hypothetical protein
VAINAKDRTGQHVIRPTEDMNVVEKDSEAFCGQKLRVLIFPQSSVSAVHSYGELI